MFKRNTKKEIHPVSNCFNIFCFHCSLVPESILKKRRTLEQVKAKRAAKATAEKKHRKKVRQIAFKSAEKYVKEYRQVSFKEDGYFIYRYS
jgi:glycyl-tRNA synthetase alpha subunit